MYNFLTTAHTPFPFLAAVTPPASAGRLPHAAVRWSTNPCGAAQKSRAGTKSIVVTWTWQSPTNMENTAATVVQPTIAPPTATEPGKAAPIKVEPAVPTVVQPAQQPPQVAQINDNFQNESLLQPRTSQQKLAIPTGPCEARNKPGYVCFFATIHNVAGKPVAVRGNALDTKELLELIYKHLSDSQKLHLKSCVHRVHSFGTPDRRAHVLARLLSSRVHFYCSVDEVYTGQIFSPPFFPLLFFTPTTPAHHSPARARALPGTGSLTTVNEERLRSRGRADTTHGTLTRWTLARARCCCSSQTTVRKRQSCPKTFTLRAK